MLKAVVNCISKLFNGFCHDSPRYFKWGKWSSRPMTIKKWSRQGKVDGDLKCDNDDEAVNDYNDDDDDDDDDGRTDGRTSINSGLGREGKKL